MSQRRRIRYIANCTTDDGTVQDIHVLVYGGPDDARYLLARRRPTWVVHSILTAAEAAKADGGGGWRVDERALREACALLGIRNPVRIKRNGRYGRTQGNHRYMPSGEHHIMLKSYLTPAQATESLWHELQHAAQAEAQGDPAAWRKYADAQRVYPYRIRPIEVEARATASLMADVPLVV